MNVVFLDYDGVVNTIVWDENGKKARYGTHTDGKVNNFQAVQWVSEFCQKFGYSIVVTSTWRMYDNYAECLKAGGLREGIEILGRTERLYDGRGAEITNYLQTHPEISHYIIIDDENIFEGYPELAKHFVHCTHNGGFNYDEFHKAVMLHIETHSGSLSL